jgi:hypothetical protein
MNEVDKNTDDPVIYTPTFYDASRTLIPTLSAADRLSGNISQTIESIKKRIDQSWEMAKMFLENQDAHGLHDSGVEIQALQRALAELEKL